MILTNLGHVLSEDSLYLPYSSCMAAILKKTTSPWVESVENADMLYWIPSDYFET